jgi:hypothetical protein
LPVPQPDRPPSTSANKVREKQGEILSQKKKHPHARTVERFKYRNAAVMQGGILGIDKLVLITMCEFAHGVSYGKIAEALGIHGLTAVRWRREMKLPKRLNAGGGYSAGKKASNGV